MELFTYRTQKEYVQAQVVANREKLDFVWVQRENVEQIVLQFCRFGIEPRVGLCHGTRGGQEQQLFAAQLPNCAILGTEISPTATSFPLTICWDFHDPLWDGRCDFVYSNSLDHAFDPKRALRSWLASLVPNGVMVIEWGSHHEEATETDPFGATIEELLSLIVQCGGEVMVIQDATVKLESAVYLKLVYVRRAGVFP